MSVLEPGAVLTDVVTWVRRIVKPDSDQSLTGITILDYINRFYQYDMPARLQLFELKRQYVFEAEPNIYQYQIPFAPFFGTQKNSDNVDQLRGFPGLQILRPPVYCDGVQIGFFNNTHQFNAYFPEQIQNTTPIEGDGTASYTHTLDGVPFLRSFFDTLGQINPYVIVSAESTGGDILYLADDGNGQLDQWDSEFRTRLLAGAGSVDYVTGDFSFTFPDTIPSGNPIRFQVVPFRAGRPTITLVENNYIKLFPIPDRTYKIQFEVQITPAGFLSTTDAVPFAYMAEYIARGAARKILSDTGDVEQLNFYEPLFKEQEVQVLRRTNRQQLTTRTPTIFSSGSYGIGSNFGWYQSN